MNENTEKCPRCKRMFPPECILPCFIAGNHVCICALCALKDRNRRHGLPKNEPFTGEMAAFAWEQAKNIYP
jgi:hypothetical protein